MAASPARRSASPRRVTELQQQALDLQNPSHSSTLHPRILGVNKLDLCLGQCGTVAAPLTVHKATGIRAYDELTLSSWQATVAQLSIGA